MTTEEWLGSENQLEWTSGPENTAMRARILKPGSRGSAAETMKSGSI